MKTKSVILLSGGLDSSANLALCAAHDEPVLALTVDYGQRAARRELESARAFCAHYGVEHLPLDARWLGHVGGSSLTESAIAMPELRTDQLDDLGVTRESAKSVWVPNRNGIFINVAAAHAERLGAKRVVVGFNREEAATFPDNTVDYLKAATAALAFSTSNQVEAFSYTAELDKREIVAKLKALAKPFPFHLLWSCYQGGERPCEVCESCRRLKRALGEV